MQNIINSLRYDHKVILTGLTTCKKTLLQGDPLFTEAFEKLCFLIESIHHFAEEEILFKPLLDEAFFYAGGPRCTYFKERILLKAESYSREGLFCPSYHPLSIPVSEHRACHELTTKIWRLWNQKESAVKNDFEIYFQLLSEHIEKEESCLFEMISSNISQLSLTNMARLYQLKAVQVEKFEHYFTKSLL